MWRGATAVSISLFAGIVIKEGLGEFLSPRRAPPLRPSTPPPRTKHRADGLTRRSNLSLLPFSYPSRFSTGSVPRPCSPYPSRPFTLLRHSSAAPPKHARFSFLHFVPLCTTARARLFVPCPQFYPPFPLALSLFHVFLVVCVSVQFSNLLSFLTPSSSLRQAAPKIPSGRSTSDSPLERAFEKKRISARSARDEKTPK